MALTWAAGASAAHLPALPDGAQTRWVVKQPLEIVRMDAFTIDGRSPNWPERGAAVLWCARVGPSDATIDLGSGQPFLVLDFWVPDLSHAAIYRPDLSIFFSRNLTSNFPFRRRHKKKPAIP